jgi:hypothetical protein
MRVGESNTGAWRMSPRLTIDDDGRVYLVETETEAADGRVTVVGFVDDDDRCPEGMAAWAALGVRWREELEDSRAERALWRAEQER